MNMPIFSGRCRAARAMSRRNSCCAGAPSQSQSVSSVVLPKATPSVRLPAGGCSQSAGAQPPVYDPSPNLDDRNPVTEAEVGAILNVYDPSSSDSLDMEAGEDGSTIVKFRSTDSNFRVGYITHDKAHSSPGQSYSDANNVSKAEIAGRYSISVKKLENGEFEYTLKMHSNLSGALLEVGNHHFTISASESLARRREQREISADSGTTSAKTLRETIREWGRTTEFSPSDRFPEGITYFDVAPLNEYIILSERRMDRNAEPLSPKEEERMRSLQEKYRDLIDRFDLPAYDH